MSQVGDQVHTDDHDAVLDADAETLGGAITPTAPSTWRTTAREFFLVLGGGIIGTLVRVAITVLLGRSIDHGFPWDIALINITGALALGTLAGWRDPHSQAHEVLWLTLAVGFLGAYTTFSSFALGIVTLALSGEALLSVLYLGGSVALGLCAAEGGLWLGARLRRDRAP